MKKLIFILLAIVSQIATADESPLHTGNSIYPYCTSTQSSSQILCSSFISGVVMGAKVQAHADKMQPMFCIPDEVNNGQIAAIYVKFMNDHPEIRHYEAVALVFISLREAFPCKS